MIAAIIPARGGSKGIPRKNIKRIAGKPLIAWTIEHALQSKMLDEVYVSTEDEEIAKISKKYGAKVLMRPNEFALDNSTTISALKYHIANELKKVDTLILLQCTSPIRNEGLIDRCVEEYRKNKSDSLATGFICKYEEWGNSQRPRQKIPGFFYDDGNVYVLDRKIVLDGKTCGRKKSHVFTSKEENIEIDDEFDFWLAEQILNKRKK